MLGQCHKCVFLQNLHAAAAMSGVLASGGSCSALLSTTSTECFHLASNSTASSCTKSCLLHSFPCLDCRLLSANPHLLHIITKGSVVLDLMSSWVSHLPPEVMYDKVLGHGLNAAELAKNKQMDSFFVRDLNQEPDGWALADQSVDAVVCCVRCVSCTAPGDVACSVLSMLLGAVVGMQSAVRTRGW
jgi:hypothetical protein